MLSRRTGLTRPNGVNTAYSYDSLSRLLSVLHKAGTVTLDGANYGYDAAGNRTSKTNLLNSITEQYTYDPIYQLTQVTQGLTTTESYSYDAVGNRLSSLGMSPYVYNSSNQLTSTPAATFTYDANGNTATKVDASGTTTYMWDLENRLTSVVLPTGTVTFKYDPLGRRIQKSSASGTTNYLYDGSNSVEEVDQTGAVLAHYAQGAGIDEPLSALRSGTAGFYEQDGLGSVTSLSNSAGAVLNSYTYDSFGNTTASTGSFVNPFLYTGRDFDPETGLRYYRARYYDANVGRFLSEDPVRYAGGINFYAYVLNNPINLTDPTGLKSCDCSKAGPLPANSPKCDNYGNETYLGVSLKCFCKCAGDSAWSQQVRGCLACEHQNGTNPYTAHQKCYLAGGLGSAPVLTLSKCYKQCFVGYSGGGPSGPPGPVGGGGGGAFPASGPSGPIRPIPVSTGGGSAW